MKHSVPIRVVVHPPKTERGQRELAQRIAALHAGHILGAISRLDCPVEQKRELLRSVIEAVKAMEQPEP